MHEWDGDSENEWFGWIARNIGDVDGDGVNDVTTSGPARNGFAGKVYAYSGRPEAYVVGLGRGRRPARNGNRSGG